MSPSLAEILRAFELQWEPLEEEWAFMEAIHDLETTCKIHGVGERDFDLMRWKCPVCGIVFDKKLKN